MLYKITCHDAGESVSVAEGLALLVSRVDFLKDKKRPSSRSPDGWPILELKNGSGIMITFEKEGQGKT
jgi:hypothetical protein